MRTLTVKLIRYGMTCIFVVSVTAYLTLYFATEYIHAEECDCGHISSGKYCPKCGSYLRK